MKKNLKYIIGCAGVAAVAFALIAFSCTGKKDRGSANTAFAQTKTVKNEKAAADIPSASLNIIEALQEVNRSISQSVLPSVVEIDVTETKKRAKLTKIFDICK